MPKTMLEASAPDRESRSLGHWNPQPAKRPELGDGAGEASGMAAGRLVGLRLGVAGVDQAVDRRWGAAVGPPDATDRVARRDAVRIPQHLERPQVGPIEVQIPGQRSAEVVDVVWKEAELFQHTL